MGIICVTVTWTGYEKKLPIDTFLAYFISSSSGEIHTSIKKNQFLVVCKREDTYR